MTTETSDRDKRTIDRWEHERFIALEADLEAAADRLAKTHPIGQVKAIGLREVALAVAEVCDELDRLRTERDALVAAWPGPRENTYAGPIAWQDDREWWHLTSTAGEPWKGRGGPGPFPSKAAAVRAAIGAGDRDQPASPAPDPS